MKEENSCPMLRIKSVLRRVTSTETDSEMTRNSAPVSRFEFYLSFLLHLFLFPPFVSQVNRETSHVQTYTHRHYTLCFHISIVKKNSSESSPMALPSNNKQIELTTLYIRFLFDICSYEYNITESCVLSHRLSCSAERKEMEI